MIEEIAKDFYRVEVPLPEILLESINSYVIRDKERHLVIDTGMQHDECFRAIEAALNTLEIDLNRTDFFVTHSHVDHLGLVSRLVCEGSVVYIDEEEMVMVSRIASGALLSDLGDFLIFSGFPERDPAKVLPPEVEEEFRSREKLPFNFLREGDVVRRGGFNFTAVSTPGHSRGHLCLHEPYKKILVAGDHLLKKITPGIQGGVDNRNPLKQYLASLDKVYALDVEVVLPGHGKPFGDHRRRVEELREHHHQRNSELLSVLEDGGLTIYQAASRMTWNVDFDSWDSFPVIQSFFATGETFAHLKYLEAAGKVEKKMEGQMAVYFLHG